VVTVDLGNPGDVVPSDQLVIAVATRDVLGAGAAVASVNDIVANVVEEVKLAIVFVTIEEILDVRDVVTVQVLRTGQVSSFNPVVSSIAN
jgi:hypothetical protein